MTHNGQFCHRSGSDWLQMANFGQFKTFFQVFPQKEAQIAFEWPISPDLQLFQSFRTKASHFLEKSQKFSLGGGGTLANFLRFETF